MPSALRGIEALLAVVEVGVLQHSVISPTLRTGLRTQHRSGEARSKRDGQKASSCEQPVGVARAGDSAPLAARSRWNATLSSDHHAQESFFDPLRTFLYGSQNSITAGVGLGAAMVAVAGMTTRRYYTLDSAPGAVRR